MNDTSLLRNLEISSCNFFGLLHAVIIDKFLITISLIWFVTAMHSKTFYEILNLNPTASHREIQENYFALKYLLLAKAYQSDIIRNNSESIRLMHLAYWTLKDEKRRREYDLKLQMDGSSERDSIKINLEISEEISSFRVKMIRFISQERLRVVFLMIIIFLLYFCADISDIDNIGNRDIFFAVSIALYFISLMSIIPML